MNFECFYIIKEKYKRVLRDEERQVCRIFVAWNGIKSYYDTLDNDDALMHHKAIIWN